MRADDFDALVERALTRIPRRFRRRVENVAIVVEPEPTPAQLMRAGVGRGGTLLGLYEGRPMTHRSAFDGFTMPDRISIFQGPHERQGARTVAELESMVAATLWHEIAHYFGMDERQVRTAERRRLLRRLS